METNDITLRRAVVFGSALVYWLGVFIQTRRVRKLAGRSANSKPHGLKEQLLWAGWFLVIFVWLALPFLSGSETAPAPVRIIPSLMLRLGLVLGLVAVALGYAGTLWCYVIMGDTWRMGIDRTEKTRLVTRGPYRLVRHPIYSLQLLMIVGVAFLLPTPLSLFILVVHGLCAWIKAMDEESYLLKVHGDQYRAYLSRTGRLLPRVQLMR